MPRISGKITFSGYTLFMWLSMVELRGANSVFEMLGQQQPPSRAIGIVTDPEAEGAERFISMVLSNPNEFLNSVKDGLDPRTAMAGLLVWKGNAILDPDGTLSFQGLTRRPTPTDYRQYNKLVRQLDEVAAGGFTEHIKHCPDCAQWAGLDPDEVCEDTEQAHEEHRGAVWMLAPETGEA